MANRRKKGKLGDRLFSENSGKKEAEKEDNLKAMLKQVKNKSVQLKLLE